MGRLVALLLNDPLVAVPTTLYEARIMTPEEFVRVLDEWCVKGGTFPEEIPRRYDVTTAGEAEAVCRALVSNHIYAVNSIKTPAFFNLAAYFQGVEAKKAEDIFRDRGLPLLRQVLSAALNDTPELDMNDYGVSRRIDAAVFILKILASYGQRGDASLFIRAARDARMSDGDLWTVIFEIVDESHPEAEEIYEALRYPLPDRRACVGYLFWANIVAQKQPMSRHPFDTDAGIARMLTYLTDHGEDNGTAALCAAMGIPFVDASAHEKLIGCADQHPDVGVRLHAARALAMMGSEFGRHRLALLCLNPRSAYKAIEYLEELGLAAHIPAKARDPDFRAMAEMCHWLASPMEFNRPPDEISLYDTRELNWPPTEDRRRLWLFKYHYDQNEDDKEHGGIGLVGSTTFALGSRATANLAPEDVYGLHCCFELEMNEDPRAPKTSSAANGRKILSRSNRGFGSRWPGIWG
jgi:hypothetical protein